MGTNAAIEKDPNSDSVCRLSQMIQWPKDSTVARLTSSLNPSTFRPPGTGPQAATHNVAEVTNNPEANSGPQITMDRRSRPALTRATGLRSSHPHTGRGPIRIRALQTQLPRASAHHAPSALRPVQSLPSNHLPDRPYPPRRETKWIRRLEQFQPEGSQFEMRLAVSLISTRRKLAFTAAVCHQIQHCIVPLSTTRILGLWVDSLATPVAPFISPWGILQPSLYTRLAVEQLVGENLRVEMGPVLVVDDACLVNVKAGIVLGQNYFDGNLGVSLPQAVWVDPTYAGHGQVQTQSSPVTQPPSTVSGNINAFSFPTPVTPNTFASIAGNTGKCFEP
ncbi:hypothetical protein QBC42DRAFT_271225 [Cladorrhinum samala]|uniref:Uncharacterized protein n=1 Tax=Cladorrhinum samala TaxID=585594 RepID=A0AAV9HPP5_9PEZI|nr:hypothetical protein QBC42DRAFT_271225 [Cladorrhinum samala]